MSLDVLTQVWLCRLSGIFSLLFLLSSQGLGPARRLGWVSAKRQLIWRRRLGLASAWLASLHVLIAWRTLLAGYFWDAFRETPWTQLGLAAWALLLLLWATSYPFLTKRFRVKSWTQLHRLTYVAALLALLHALRAPWSNPLLYVAFFMVFLIGLGLRFAPSNRILKR